MTKMQTEGRVLFVALVLVTTLAGAAWAADAPDLLNYQGVLRDASNGPLEGSHDMTFRFFTAEVGGSEILVDTHDTLNDNPVTVTGGMFNVALGGGTIIDGSGPGIFVSLRKVFKVYQEVYLDVEVNGEVLVPRVRVIAAAYAMNASNLGGKAPGEFLDTSSTTQTKTGPLSIDASSVGTSIGVEGLGQQSGGYFRDSDASGYAYTGFGDYGVRGFGNASGGYFRDANSTGYAQVGHGDYGVQGYGNTAGAYFQDLDHGGRAYVGYGTYGVYGSGSESGGYFEDSDDGTMADVGSGPFGIYARGHGAGGLFLETDGTGQALVAANDLGIDGVGQDAGAYFGDSDGSGAAWVAYGDLGIMAQGTEAGGYFRHPSLWAEAWLAKAPYGIEATSSVAGGYFHEMDGSGFALVGYEEKGIHAGGDEFGGHFYDKNNSGKAWVGREDLGIDARGWQAGGYFEDSSESGFAFVGYGNEGISAHGNVQGGYFQDDDSSGQAHVAYGDRGIWAKGTLAGATFSHPDNITFWADVATPTHKITGNGALGFVQNHPYDENRVIVYTAPEGDEAAVYHRGTARLVDGQARVPLGETFRWVANPDIGLTAHLTPRGNWSDLYVESITTEELVVRAVDGPGDATFDYFVFGLRLGFEELAVVDAKHREAPLPPTDVIQSSYAQQPELRSYNALERFRSTAVDLTGAAPDLSRAAALRQAVLESGRQDMGKVDPAAERADRASALDSVVSAPEVIAKDEADSGATPDDAPATSGFPVAPVDPEQEEGPETWDSLTMFPVSEVVEPGDLLILDPDSPGTLRRSDMAADPSVVGIAAAEPVMDEGQLRVELVDSLFAVVAADATYGAIYPGDLLMTSPTPGHAMTAVDPAPGTVVAKALEPLESGTARIKILLMSR